MPARVRELELRRGQEHFVIRLGKRFLDCRRDDRFRAAAPLVAPHRVRGEVLDRQVDEAFHTPKVIAVACLGDGCLPGLESGRNSGDSRGRTRFDPSQGLRLLARLRPDLSGFAGRDPG